MSKPANCAYIVSLLNDAFAAERLHGMHAWQQDATHVCVQYHSAHHGDTRAVRCNAAGLLKWLHGTMGRYGWKQDLVNKLDRKPAWESPLQQAEFNLSTATPLARRSMAPGD